MIKLGADVDYVYMILVAAAMGVIGGLGAELLVKRGEQTGTIELPGRVKGTRFFDIGLPASLILGAIAAVAVLYFFPPVVETITTGPDGKAPVTTHEYDLIKLVALSLIVGSAGPAFLATAQSRLMSAINAQKLGTAVDTGKTQANQVAESAKAAVSGAVQEAISAHIPTADAATQKAVADSATASLESALAPQLKVAIDQMDAVAG